MPFPNVKRIFQVATPLSGIKLCLAQAISSRPAYRSLFSALLRPFVHNDQITFRYRCYEQSFLILLRRSDLDADRASANELCCKDIYHIDRNFSPDLVIDGGGNIGLFTLRAAAAFGEGEDGSTKYVLCEPLPRNIVQIEKHLAMNRISTGTEILPCCLGRDRGTIPFYCRAANESSFDASLPYDEVLEIDVIRLRDAIGSHPAERILIKLDIEGMEVEVLSEFVPGERRAIYVVGELHRYPVNAPLLENLFVEHGWTFEFFDVDRQTASFRACSPLAAPSLAWAVPLQRSAIAGSGDASLY